MRSPTAAEGVWALARRQHGVVARSQLVERGLTRHGIAHRVRTGRLHRVCRGVFAVGRPELTRRGRWMAAVLSVGRGAALSHESATALWGIEDRERLITLTLPSRFQSRRADLRVHRRELAPADVASRDGIPVTSPARTLLDLAAIAGDRRVEAAVNAADKLGLIDPEALRSEVERRSGLPGSPALRRLLDSRTFRLTDSELERRFLRLVRAARLPQPRTGERIEGYRVDFAWPQSRLVVETDGLRYHRTPAQQARDRQRDQRLQAAGWTVLRFTHAQVSSEPEAVAATLAAVLGGM